MALPPSDTSHKWHFLQFFYVIENFSSSTAGKPYLNPLISHRRIFFTLFSNNFQAHLVSGVYEQTFVADIQEFALCVGRYENEDHCNDKLDNDNEGSSSAVKSAFVALFLAIFGPLL